MVTALTRRETADGAWLGHGALGGLLGGGAIMAFEIALAAVALGASWALLPLRMAAGILLGPGAVDPASPIVPVAVAGMVVHLTLSAAFGVLFASIMERDGRRRPAATMLLAAIAYGCGLWLVNFYVIAPFAGWEWFPRRTSPIVQLVAHAVFYAPLVGLYLHRIESRRRAAVIEAIEPPAVSRRRAA